MAKKYESDGQSAEDKALSLFSEMICDKIRSLKDSDLWQKPWFTEGSLSWPKNLAGRPYNGQNALMLTLHCEKEGYKIPRFCTFDALQRMNAEKKEQPRVLVTKGEKSFPIFLTTFTCVNRDTKEKIPWEDYKKLSDDDKKQYNVYPRQHVFRVFNIDQTNLKEVRPELYAKLEAECTGRRIAGNGEQFNFEPLDRMIRDNGWICPIKPTYGDDAYYSISRNVIIVPERRQFSDGESFAGTCFHEMAHSTGSKEHFDRLKPTTSADYAREELVAELSAALVSMRHGMMKMLKSDSAPYLKSWLGSLDESPDFIKTVLGDVKRASDLICQNIEKMQQKIDAERSAGASESLETAAEQPKEE
ncbi:MAG: zincin-like metallopeptidase domain-containing protein, partial [Muribaculaceae bacterium]